MAYYSRQVLPKKKSLTIELASDYNYCEVGLASDTKCVFEIPAVFIIFSGLIITVQPFWLSVAARRDCLGLLGTNEKKLLAS